MDRKIVGFAGLLAISALILGSPPLKVGAAPAAHDVHDPGAIYVSPAPKQATPKSPTETGGNVISVFNRAGDGTLKPAASFPPANLDRQPNFAFGNSRPLTPGDFPQPLNGSTSSAPPRKTALKFPSQRASFGAYR